VRRRDPDQGLPPFAIEYLAGAPACARVIRSFHAWLRRSGRPILQLQPHEIDQFLTPYLAHQKTHLRTRDRRHLFRYFGWLHSRRLLPFDPRHVWPDFSAGRCLYDLPSQAIRYLKTLEPTHKSSTVDGYRSSLGQFHMWLDSQALTIDAIGRTHVSAWLQWLHGRKLSAGHRIQLILAVRAYCQWLGEQPEYLGPHVDQLFRRGDLPKRPDYLPRPICADLDRLVQRRLRKSNSLPQLGLLLMRRTGLRIGELRALPFHCVHVDHRGNSFLKVPLGKLNSERLVPLDRVTLRLIKNLRVHGSTGRRGRRRTLLLETAAAKPIPFETYRLGLKHACRGLTFTEPMTTHRLRHTYATSMLAGGVSLPVLMKLLGHRHYQMTLRYAAITPEIVATECADAIHNVEQRYALSPRRDEAKSTPDRALTDFGRFVMRHVEDNGLDKQQARVLIGRLRRLNTAIQRLLRGQPAPGTR
jgi:site-specific recombinase XerD